MAPAGERLLVDGVISLHILGPWKPFVFSSPSASMSFTLPLPLIPKPRRGSRVSPCTCHHDTAKNLIWWPFHVRGMGYRHIIAIIHPQTEC